MLKKNTRTKGIFKYYFAQAVSNTKRNYLILITFAIAFSLVASLAFIGQSAKSTVIMRVAQESNQIGDISIDYRESLGNFFYTTPDFDAKLKQEINSVNFPNFDYSFYCTEYLINDNFLMQNDTAQMKNTEFLFYFNEFKANLHFLIGDNQLYNQPDFAQKVILKEGHFPRNNQEIMIDILLADALNLQVGQEVNFEYFYQRYHGIRSYKTDINWTISGISINQQDFSLIDHSIKSYYSYDEIRNILSLNEDLFEEIGGAYSDKFYWDLPIYGYFNFTNEHSLNTHPYVLMRENHPAFKIIENTYFVNYSSRYEFIDYGMGIVLDKENFNFNRIQSTVKEIELKMNEVSNEFDSKIVLDSTITDFITEFQANYQSIQLILFLINIPVIFFAIILGSIAIHNEMSNRLEEYLLLRSKGIDNKILQNQLIIETLSLSFFASILGFFFGIPLFFVIRNLISETLSFYEIPNLQFLFNFHPLFISMIIAAFTCLIAAFGSIISIKRLRSHELLKILGQESLYSDYTEVSLYKSMNSSNQMNDSSKSIKKSPEIQELEKELQKTALQNTILVNEKDHSSREKEKKQLHRIYQKSLKKRKKDLSKSKEAKIALWLIIIGLIPIIYIFLSIWAQNPNAPDYLHAIFGTTQSDGYFATTKIYDILPFLLILSPIFIIPGIIRLISVEKPFIYAKISKFITYPVLGKIGELLGLESIKKRQYGILSAILGVFIAITIFANSILFSFMSTPVLDYQALAGSDIRVTMYNPIITAGFESNPITIENLEDLNNFEENLKMINISNNRLVKDVMTLFTEPISKYASVGGSSNYILRSYANLSEIVNFIAEDEKFIPDEKFDLLTNIEGQNIQGLPNCIITSDFAEFYNVKVGEVITLEQQVFYEKDYIIEPMLGVEIRPPTIYKYNASIAGIIDIIPGIWVNGYCPLYPHNKIQENKEQIYSLVDISALDIVPFNLSLFSYSHLLNLQNNFVLNLTTSQSLEGQVRNISENVYSSLDNVAFYIDTIEEMQLFEGKPNVMSVVNKGLIFEFGIIGLILSFGVGILIVSFQQNNRYFNGILLAQGYGKRGLFKFVLSLIMLLYFTAYALGIILGFSISFLNGKVMSLWENYTFYGAIELPIMIKWEIILGIMGVIPFITVMFYLISFQIESNKSVSKYFHKF